MAQLLITGFTPFDGRDINGSWVAAQSFPDAEKLEIPVIWGQPMEYLEAEIHRSDPEIIISMGEGKEGQFTVETRAQNQRKHRIDNLNQYPVGNIRPDGPGVVFASIDSSALVDHIARQNIPMIVSHDAGQFLCEETLYCLELLKRQYDKIRLVTFVHLPPFGTKTQYLGESVTVDQTILSDFTQRLVNAVLSIDAFASHQTQNRG